MAITHAATIPLNLYYHWKRILENYVGKECTHTKVTKVLDLNGGVIDKSSVNTTIIGAITNVSQDTASESAGLFKYGDLVAYFMSEEGVIVGEQTNETSVRYDLIVYKGESYQVRDKLVTAYDDDVAVVDKFKLCKVAD